MRFSVSGHLSTIFGLPVGGAVVASTKAMIPTSDEINCAKCHDHPLVSDWKQEHYYGLKSFFARTVDSGGFLGERDFGVVKYIPNKGVEKVSPILFLNGKKIDAPGMKDPTGEQKKKEQMRLDQGKKAKAPPAPPTCTRSSA